MSILSTEQKEFLDKHNVSLGSVFDATGLGLKDYRQIMKDLGKGVAIGVTPCKKSGHAMRSRSGNCIQCNTANLSFQKRHSMEAFVYVAGSRTLSVIKVGLAASTKERMVSLNQLNYAGTDDWTCLFWVKTDHAGKVENDSHKDLERFASPLSYERDGRDVNCLETFTCPARIAIATVKAQASNSHDYWECDSVVSEYEFEPQEGGQFKRYIGGRPDGGAIPLYRSKPAANETGSIDRENVKEPLEEKADDGVEAMSSEKGRHSQTTIGDNTDLLPTNSSNYRTLLVVFLIGLAGVFGYLAFNQG
jgi:hypothetical protein